LNYDIDGRTNTQTQESKEQLVHEALVCCAG